MSHPDAQVVITGAGLVTCLGLDVPATWKAVLERKPGIGPLTALEGVPFGINPDEIKWRGGQAPVPAHADGGSREVGLLRRALDEAWESAGLLRHPYPAHRCGFAMGTTLHGMRHAGAYLRSDDISHIAGFLAGVTLREATRGLYPRGPMLTTCAACASGLGSIGIAMTLLRAGVLDLVIAGGYDPISEYSYAGFHSLRLIGAGPSRPFCKDRDGMMISEGYAVVVLERAEDAMQRGGEPLAWVRGVGESSDCHHLTQPHPEGEGATRAIRAAMSSAGIEPDDIGLISAHATGTPNNDAAEAAALTAVFGPRLRGTPVVAFKSHIGHALGGAGAAELILSATSMRDQVVPATANIESADIEFPDIALNTTSPRAWGIDSTLNLSLGFGGANACAILTRPASMARNPQVQRNGSLDEVVVTGSGVIFPGVTGSTQLARHLADAEPEETPVSGSVPEDQYSHLVSARRVRRMSDYVKLTLGATALAFADAQIDDVPAFGEDCSAVLGTTHGSTTYCETYYSQIVRDGLGAANPMLFAEGVPNAAAAQLSMMFQVKGLCQTVIGTRTAGLDALWLAALRIASGQWRRAVVCAGEEFSPVIARAYERHGLYSSAGLGAPFSTQTGFVGTAGAATLILESRAAAESRGARCLGRVLAGHSSSTEHLASRNGVEGIRRCLGSVGNSTNVLSSSNGTWIDRVEALGIASSRRGRGSAVVSSLYAHIAESFSVGSLAGIAGILAVPGSGEAPKSRAFPALRSPWGGYRGLALPTVPGTRVSDFTALCCDYAGIVSAVGIQCF